MNQFLSIALKTHFESLKVGGKGENYWQCYQAFLKYCDIYGDCDLKDLFNNKLLRQDIVCACASYYNSSAKAHRKEAVNRFLSAIDLFYKNYIKKMGGIECSALEGGCRNNEMIEDIEKCLNTKLKQEIYCPIDDKIEIEIIKICNNLKKSDFYKFGQKILCNLLLKYGFKLNLLVNLKKADVNDIDGIITIRNKDSVINLSVDKSMVSDIRQYNMVHRYPNREYFFLNTKGKKITSSSALATIQEKLEEVAKNIDIKLIKDKVYLNNEDVTEKIRSNEVSDIVSPISNYIGVRESMLHLQRSYAKNNDIVMEGRDITTVVFPNATFKFYLDATLEERANRRYKQNKLNNISCTYEEVLENIEKRDYNDLHKKVGALKRSDDQVYIDTTNKTIEEVVDIILNVVRGEK